MDHPQGHLTRMIKHIRGDAKEFVRNGIRLVPRSVMRKPWPCLSLAFMTTF